MKMLTFSTPAQELCGQITMFHVSINLDIGLYSSYCEIALAEGTLLGKDQILLNQSHWLVFLDELFHLRNYLAEKETFAVALSLLL